MQGNGYRIFPLGDSALTVEFGTGISLDLNKKALALAAYFDQKPFAGFIECVPAYSSTSVFYDPVKVRANNEQFATAFDAVKSLAETGINATGGSPGINKAREIEIPVNFGREAALDLDFVAENHCLSTEEVVDIFTVSSSAPVAHGRPAAVPAAAARPGSTGIKGLQQKVKQAAKSYLTRGNTAVDKDWAEF